MNLTETHTRILNISGDNDIYRGSTAFYIVNISIGSATVLINLFICTILRNPVQRLPDMLRFQILGQSASDVVAGVALSTLCLTAFDFANRSPITCSALLTFVHVSNLATVFNLGILSIRRWYVIKNMQKMMLQTNPRKVLFYTLFAWIMAVVCMSPLIFLTKWAPSVNGCLSPDLSVIPHMSMYPGAFQVIGIMILNVFYIVCLLSMKILTKQSKQSVMSMTQIESTPTEKPTLEGSHLNRKHIVEMVHDADLSSDIDTQISKISYSTEEVMPSDTEGTLSSIATIERVTSDIKKDENIENIKSGMHAPMPDKKIKTSAANSRTVQAQKRAFIQLFIVLIVANVGIWPFIFHVMPNINGGHHSRSEPSSIYSFGIQFLCINSFVNPFVYAFHIEAVRRTLRTRFTCCW